MTGRSPLSITGLTDGDDDSAWETLRELGYDTGDVFPVATFNPQQDWSHTSTASSFTSRAAVYEGFIRWDRFIPSSATGMCAISGKISPGTDESADVRYQNVTDGETLVDKTGVTAEDTFQTAWSSYTPTTTGSAVRVRYQHRTQTGANSTTYQAMALWLGIRIP